MRNPELGPKFEPKEKEETIEEKISKGEKEELKENEFQRETIEKLKEAVRKFGTSSEKIRESEYWRYYRRLWRHREEWGYKSWRDFLEKRGLKKPLKEENIEKLKEAIKVLGTTSSSKIKEGGYINDYAIFNRYREEWGYKSWRDFLAREILAKEAWNEFWEKYKHILGIKQLSTELFVEHFLERNYPDRKAGSKEKVVELLSKWREEKVSKSQEK